MTDFDLFWNAYPNKKGKGAARKAFDKAIRLTDINTMLAAIDIYRKRKPDWQHFAHPATWLNQERWDDEWPEPTQQASGSPRSFDNVIPIPKRTNYVSAFNQKWEGK